MRRWLLLAGLLAAPACTVGDGSGEAKGQLFVLGCKSDGSDLGSPEAPDEYSLEPQFFAGEPHSDIGTGRVKANRLIIRIQSTGRRRELTDVLTFDMVSAFEAARCVRGRVVGGKPDFDDKNCSWATGVPRLRVAPDAQVRVYFTPRATCPGDRRSPSNAVGTAISRLEGQWDSWVELLQFGEAVAEPAVPPDQRPTTRTDFRVDFSQRIFATGFHLVLRDDVLVKMIRPNANPEIGGMLDGRFDFDLERGQGAQTFP